MLVVNYVDYRPSGLFHFDIPAHPNRMDPIAEKTGAIMLFSSGGKVFNTDDLKPFETGDSRTPVIYLDVDSSRIFIQHRDRWKADITEIDADELRELAKRLDLHMLIDHLIRKAQQTMLDHKWRMSAVSREMMAKAKSAIENFLARKEGEQSAS